MNRARFVAILGFVLAGVMSRFLPHPPNFTSINAIALFAGIRFQSRRPALLIVLASMLLSDLVLGLHPLMPIVYACFALTTLVGGGLCKRNAALRAPVVLISSSLLFFLATNFGVWLLSSFYPKTLTGLGLCYAAAIPFLGNQILGDLSYGALIFGGFALAEKAFPVVTWRDVGAPHVILF